MVSLYVKNNSLITNGNQFGCCCSSSSSSSSSSSPTTYTYKIITCGTLTEYKLSGVTQVLALYSVHFIVTAENFSGCVLVIPGDPTGLPELTGPIYEVPFDSCEDCLLSL